MFLREEAIIAVPADKKILTHPVGELHVMIVCRKPVEHGSRICCARESVPSLPRYVKSLWGVSWMTNLSGMKTFSNPSEKLLGSAMTMTSPHRVGYVAPISSAPVDVVDWIDTGIEFSV
jgi:hypothetical protein